jgi:DNA-binding response OmpR family regulator
MTPAYDSIHIAPYPEAMVADGDRMFCVLMDEYLRILGFNETYLVTSEELVLWKLARRRFDIMFLETCQEYRDIWENVVKGKYGSSLIVAVTFDRSGRDWLKAIQYGADTVLTKPLTVNRLKQALSSLLTSPASRRCKIVQLPSAVRASGGRDHQQGSDL